jgi:hypothetical protein
LISLAAVERKAVARERNRGNHEHVAREAREALACLLEAGNLARDRDGSPPWRRLGLDLAVAPIHVAMGERRRRLAIVGALTEPSV